MNAPGRRRPRGGRTRALAIGAVLAAAACRSYPAPPPPSPPPAPPAPGPAAPPAILRDDVVYPFVAEGDLASADAILADRWPVDRYEPVVLRPLTWREDPYGERYWRFEFYGLRPLRHLAWAWRATHRDAYATKLAEVLSSFTTTATGSPHLYDDSHAVAFRVMVITHARAVLAEAGRLPPALAAGIDAQIDGDAAHLEDPAHFEKANNHGLTEAAALALAGVRFAHRPDADRWRALGTGRIRETVLATVDDDGVQIEDSPFYHFYELRFLAQVTGWATRAGVVLAPEVTRRIGQMADAAAWMVQPDGQVPLLSSSVALDVRRYAPEVLEPLAARHPHLALVLSGGRRGAPPAGRARLFPDSGLAVLRPRFSPPPDFALDTQVVLDTGPWRTNHSQYDALSVIAYSQGRTLLPDSGLFRYDGTRHQTYFDRTAAHNTVVVDGTDQQGPGGEVTAGLTATGHAGAEPWAFQSGRHRLYPGVTHTRGVWVAAGGSLVVLDHLTSSTPHRYAQTWHAPPGSAVTVEGATASVRDASGEVRTRLAPAGPVAVLTGHGDDGAVPSWHSAAYGERTPTDGLAFARTATDTWLVTAVGFGPRATGVAVSATPAAGGVDAHVCGGGGGVVVRWRQPVAGGESVTAEPGRCAGAG